MFSKLRKCWKYIACAAVAVPVLAIFISDYAVGSHSEGRLYSDVTKIPARRTGLLLGCSKLLRNGRRNTYFNHRIEAAVAMYEAKKIDRIIVSGDNSRIEYDESSDMKNELVANGIPADHVYCDYAGFRTLDSVIRSKAIFQQERITVISQKFHNERALFIAQSHGIDAIGYNAESVTNYHGFRTRLREKLARVLAMLDIYVLGTGPRFFGPKIQIK